MSAQWRHAPLPGDEPQPERTPGRRRRRRAPPRHLADRVRGGLRGTRCVGADVAVRRVGNAVAVGQRLTITVQSNRAGELHVHSDPEHTFEFGAGTETFRLTVDTPGSVDIEEHESDALVARLLVR